MSEKLQNQSHQNHNKADADTGKPVPFVGKGFQPESRQWIGYLVFVIIIFLVELGTTSGVISSLTLPKPSDVLETMIELYHSGLLFKHLVPSISRLIL